MTVLGANEQDGGEDHHAETVLLIDALLEAFVEKGVSPDIGEIRNIFYDEANEPRDDDTVFNDVAEYCIENGIDLEQIVDSLEFPAEYEEIEGDM